MLSFDNRVKRFSYENKNQQIFDIILSRNIEETNKSRILYKFYINYSALKKK